MIKINLKSRQKHILLKMTQSMKNVINLKSFYRIINRGFNFD